MRSCGCLVDTFKALTEVVYNLIRDLGEDKDAYVVFIHPFSIERIDGKPLPRFLVHAIEAKLSA